MQETHSGNLRTYRKLTSTLQVIVAKAQDNGTYECITTNKEGVNTDDVTIHVFSKYTSLYVTRHIESYQL